jgi:RNA-binding protein YlmH
LKDLAVEHQKNQQVILTYRKDEILDLLSSLTKAEVRISEAQTNELNLKKEKL